jgi:hypothetical protein
LKTAAPALIDTDVKVTVRWTGGCQGLYLDYDSGGSGALLRQNFGTVSPSVVTLAGHPQGTENWSLGAHALRVLDGNGGPYRSITLTIVNKGDPS